MSTLLKIGSRGDEVVKLQSALGVAADGIFGKITHAALVEFQKKNNLDPDGIAGPKTFAVLYGKKDQTKPPKQNTSTNVSRLVDTAKIVITTYQKNDVKYSQAKRQFGIDAKFSDCSATVSTILRLANYSNLLSSTNTRAMRAEIAAKGGKFRKDNPKPGDIMMWGGHVTIVTEADSDSVNFAHMGRSGPRIAQVALVKNALKTETTWGSGGFIGFWTIS